MERFMLGALAVALAVFPVAVMVCGRLVARRRPSPDTQLSVLRAFDYAAVTCGVLIGGSAAVLLIRNFGDDATVLYLMAAGALYYPLTYLCTAVQERTARRDITAQ